MLDLAAWRMRIQSWLGTGRRRGTSPAPPAVAGSTRRRGGDGAGEPEAGDRQGPQAQTAPLMGDRWAELDLAALVAAGHGDVPLIRLPLRSSACGRTGHQIKVSGRSYGLA
jgi:hypothetical protein